MKLNRASYDVFAVGNALVDIQAQVAEEFLARHNLTKGVMTLVDAARQIELLADLKNVPVHTSPGGSACNTVVGLAGLGGRGYYAGKVGHDAHGAFFREELRTLGILSDLAPSDSPTGTCLVLNTPDADRTMLTCLAASVELSAADIDPAQIAQARFVYVEGYLWDAQRPRSACEAALEAARRCGVKVAFSYSDPFCVARAREDFRRLTQEQVDLVFCNQDEACMITGEPDGPAACRRIASWGPEVFVTLGAEGACFAAKDQWLVIEPFPVTATDTNGAGDLFAAGALFALCRGYGPAQAGRLGSYAASLVVQRTGARLPGEDLAGALAVLGP
jgi:sugar/nucleoside kinase (ribokinase family)